MKTAPLSRLRASLFGFALLLATAFAFEGHAQTPLDDRLKQVSFEQHTGASVTLNTSFVDEAGHPVSLATYATNRPVILVPGYYGCPMLCKATATGLVNTLRDISLLPGKDFTVLHFSIDPGEKPELAAQKKRSYLKSFGKSGTEDGWHFLTSPEGSSRKLADEIGFHYMYDPASKQFAHASGFVVLTPSGKISQYFFGVNFPAADLEHALSAAKGENIGSRLRQLLLLCFHYQPITGRFGLAALLAIRISAIALVAGLVFWIVRAIRAEKPEHANPSA